MFVKSLESKDLLGRVDCENGVVALVDDAAAAEEPFAPVKVSLNSALPEGVLDAGVGGLCMAHSAM